MTITQPEGFLATPATGKGIGVLVLHAWWGLNETVQAFCERLAESGFIAYAPDLYHGRVVDGIDEAERLSNALFGDLDQSRADIATAATFLRERSGRADGNLAVIGFSLGAFFALDLSVAEPDHVRSVVIFYGTRPGDYSESRAAYLGHFAEADEFEPRSVVDELEAALRQAGRLVDFYHYAGTGHWFFEPDRRKAFNRTAAELAWERTLAFLKDSMLQDHV